jgi:hypothetical protein
MSAHSARSSRYSGRTPDRIVRIALLFAIAIHVLLALALREAMRQPPSNEGPGLLVHIIDAAPAEPPLPEPSPPDRSASAPEAHPLFVPSLSNRPQLARAPTLPTGSTTPPTIASPQWFNADGSVRLAPVDKPTPHEAGMERGRELLARGHNVLRCSHSRFDPRPTAEEEGNEAIRSTRLLGNMFQRPWDIQAQHDAQVQADVSASSDLAIDERKVEDETCDDAFSHRPWAKPASADTAQWSDKERP